MHLISKNKFRFMKDVALLIIGIFVATDNIRWNKVDAAIISYSESIRASEKFCEDTCQSKICHDEAYRFFTYIDESIDPCDDFFYFSCGKVINRLKNIPISESESAGMFGFMQGIINRQTYSMINETNPDYPESFVKMQTFYRNCMNQSEGIDSILRILADIGGFPMLVGDNWNERAYDWKEALYKIIDERIFVTFPVFIDIEGDSDSSKKILVVKSANTADFAFQKYNDLDIISESMIALGLSPEIVKTEVDELFNFQIKLRNIKSTDEQISSQTINDTEVSISVLAQNYPSIPWLKMFNKILNRHDFYVDSSDVVTVDDRKFINNLESLINATPKRVIANYLAWNVLATVYLYLPKPFHQLSQKYKLDETATRAEFCLARLNDHFSLAMSSLYVREYLAPSFDDEIKKDVETIVKNIKNQIRRNIEEVEWMDDHTKAAALKKLGAMHDLVGFEKELLDDEAINQYYSELEITPDNFLKNGISAYAFQVSKHYKSSKIADWTIRKNAVEFNADYSYGTNAIDIHAAFLQAFMYSYGRPQYLNYGALGSIVGHEIMHGFDNIGREYDENGFLNNWWFNDTEKKYLEKVQYLIDQYSNFTIPNTNLTVDGVKTQNENIADNGGFKAAYHAYNKWVEQSGASEGCLPGFHYTPKQMFWISSATNWCSRDGVEYLRNLINADPHPPHYPRVVLSFSNIKEFAEDFKCRTGSRMNPEKRCNIW